MLAEERKSGEPLNRACAARGERFGPFRLLQQQAVWCALRKAVFVADLE